MVDAVDVGSVLDAPVEATPVAWLTVVHRGTHQRVGLKLEGTNATGSVKHRTATGLLRSLHEQRPLVPGSVVVESTSGNLGIALAHLLRRLGCRFIAVVDVRTPPWSVAELRSQGAEVVVVDTPDRHGGYLLERLTRVHAILAANPGYRWTNQYENPANPAVHASTTGPEILAQVPDVDAVYVPVSTGGTLAGISASLGGRRTSVSVVAVDAHGSRAVRARPGRRLISGIGSSRPSRFLDAGTYDRVVHVGDSAAVAACRALREDVGLRLGGSSGSVLRAFLRDLDDPAVARPVAPVCLCADGGDRYADTLYSDTWLAEHGLGGEVAAAHARLRSTATRFTWEDPR